MKRKRGPVKRKPKLTPGDIVDEVIQSVVRANANEEWGLDDYDNYEVDHQIEIEMPAKGRNRHNKLKTYSQNKKIALPMAEDSTSPLAESNVAAASTNLSKKARIKLTNSSRGVSSSSVEPSNKAEQVQNRTHQKEPNVPYPDLQYKEQELKAALAVIKKVMEMDAAAPFNVPVDPVALGIADYFDVISTPMDFGTICNNLENGLTYTNTKDVLRDVQYIWDNCCKYNKKGHYILELMKRVKKKFIMFWTEAGLHMDQLPKINGHSHLPPTKSTAATRSIYGRKSPLDALADCAKNSRKDQDESIFQPHQTPLSYTQSHQPQQGPFQLNSGQQQSSQPLACRNGDSAGHSHIPPLRESSVRRSPRGHGYQVGSLTDNPTCSQQKQRDMGQPKNHLHQPSANCCQPYQPQKRSCQLTPSSGRQQSSPSVAELDITSAGNCAHIFSGGDFNPSCPEKSKISCSKRGSKTIDSMTDCIPHHQHDQPSSSYVQQHQPLVETCRGLLSASKQPTSSAKPCAGVEMGNAEEEFQSPPPLESMIRCTKSRPIKYAAGHVTDIISRQQQDQISASHPQSHQPSLNYGQQHQSQVGMHDAQRSSSHMHPSSGKPRIGTEMDSSDEFHSPPPVESMISCAKHGPTRLPADTMPDIVIRQQQDQINPSEMQSQEAPCQGLLSSSQRQPSHSQAPLGVSIAVSSKKGKKTRGRGPTRCLEVWNSEDKIPVATDEFGQPIGPEAPKLIFFLGTIARNGHITPLNYVNWKAVPDENKEKMWKLVESKFDIDPQSKGSILKSIGTKWKNWKALLKANHYNPHESDEERLADCNERVLPDQWRILVSFWNSTEAKERSNRNKANRSKYTSNHACGSKSFARLREEQRVKNPEGKEPSRADLFIVTRTRKDGRPVNEASSVIISQLRDAAQQQGTSQNDTIADEVFVQVMGEERHGSKCTYGLGPAPSDLNSFKPLPAEAMRMVSEANAEVREMKEKMMTMEQTCAQMASQIATMMSMMQRKFLANDPPNFDASRNPEGTEHSFSSRHGFPPLQRSTTRSGKRQSTSTSKVVRKGR